MLMNKIQSGFRSGSIEWLSRTNTREQAHWRSRRVLSLELIPFGELSISRATLVLNMRKSNRSSLCGLKLTFDLLSLAELLLTISKAFCFDDLTGCWLVTVAAGWDLWAKLLLESGNRLNSWNDRLRNVKGIAFSSSSYGRAITSHCGFTCCKRTSPTSSMAILIPLKKKEEKRINSNVCLSLCEKYFSILYVGWENAGRNVSLDSINFTGQKHNWFRTFSFNFYCMQIVCQQPHPNALDFQWNAINAITNVSMYACHTIQSVCTLLIHSLNFWLIWFLLGQL